VSAGCHRGGSSMDPIFVWIWILVAPTILVLLSGFAGKS
jgi:hypothetical protein